MNEITTFLRENEVIFTGNSLCPDKTANMFLDNTQINSYCQRGNKLVVTSANNAAKFTIGDKILNTTTKMFGKVLATSNNVMYIDQNYLTINVSPYSSSISLSQSDFDTDDIVYQAYLVPRTGNVQEITPSTHRLYSTFQNTFGVWLHKVFVEDYSYRYWHWGYHTRHIHREYDASVVGQITRSYSVYFPVNGALDGNGKCTYYYAFAIDDRGTFYLDDVAIKTVEQSGHTWLTNPTYTAFQVTPGVHTVKWVAENLGTPSVDNPGSVALHITTFQDARTNSTLFSSRNPPNINGYDEIVTFQGRVAYYDAARKILAMVPEKGVFNATPNIKESTLMRVKGGTYVNVGTYGAATTSAVISGDIFPAGSSIVETSNSSNTAIISSYSHYSGVVVRSNSQNQIQTIGNPEYLEAKDKVITFTAGSILADKGYKRIVTNVEDNILTLNTAVAGIQANSRFTIGDHVVDDHGVVSGIFNIPERPDAKFTTGEKLFTITDTTETGNNLYSMRATGTYKVTGEGTPSAAPVSTISAANPEVKLPRVRTAKGFDPMAQTFFVPGANTTNDSGDIQTSYGVHISSIDLFFAQKPQISLTNPAQSDEQLPVTVSIVTVENDIPTSNVLAQSIVECRNVNVSTLPSLANTSTLTNFKFSTPVHLETDKNYAITINTDSPYYSLYVAELGGNMLGVNPPRRVSEQPYVGNFYKAQNASNWTPILNTDLMFRMNKCQFATNSLGTILMRPKNVTSNVSVDSIVIHTIENNSKPTSTKYKVRANNVNGVDTAYQYIDVNTEYSFGEDLVSSNKGSSRRRIIVGGDPNSFNVGVEFFTTDPTVSPIISREKMSAVAFENIINDASLANSKIGILTGGLHANTSNITVTISAPDDTINGVQAQGYAVLVDSISANNIFIGNAGSGYSIGSPPTVTISNSPTNSEMANNTANAYATINGGGIATIVVDKPGSGYANVVPTITIAAPGSGTTATAYVRSNVAAVYLTEQGSGYFTTPTITISEPSMSVNAVAHINGETDASGGNCVSRYITKRVDLAPGFDAGDLRVFLDCIRPRGTNINVYYKVKSSADPDTFDSKTWQLMNKMNDLYSKDQDQVIELEFRPNTLKNVLSYNINGTAYPIGGKFNQYAIKVTLSAADTTVVPYVKNLSAIATPEG